MDERKLLTEDTQSGGASPSDSEHIFAHHEKSSLCETRPTYRQGRKQTAVKVYTVNDESVYLLIQGVPALGVKDDLHRVCSKFGTVTEIRMMDEYPNIEEFTDVYLIKYDNIRVSRKAKRKLDDLSFFGGVLHVCYAPEYESLDETRAKLQERRKTIASKCYALEKDRTVGTDISAYNEEAGNSSYWSQNSDNRNIYKPTFTSKQTSHNPNNSLSLGNPYAYTQQHYGSMQTNLHLGGASEEPHLPLPLIDPSSKQQRGTPVRVGQLSVTHKPTAAAQAAMWSHNTFCEPTPVIDNQNVLHSKSETDFVKHTKFKPQQTIRETYPQPNLNGKSLVVRREVKSSSAGPPRFVPRQTTKILTKTSDDQVLVNAAVLGQAQGPELPPCFAQDVRGKHMATDDTTLEIRAKVKKILTTSTLADEEQKSCEPVTQMTSK